jgi:hypothetical protein
MPQLDMVKEKSIRSIEAFFFNKIFETELLENALRKTFISKLILKRRKKLNSKLIEAFVF